jgi:hypothetical protein
MAEMTTPVGGSMDGGLARTGVLFKLAGLQDVEDSVEDNRDGEAEVLTWSERVPMDAVDVA